MDKLYSIFDKRAERYAPPFLAKNDAVAARHYQMYVESLTPSMRNDFSVFRLADWDRDTGVLDALSIPEEVNVLENVQSFKDLTEVSNGN